MDMDVFKKSLRNIYAAHGRAAPSEAVLLVLWRRIRKLENSFILDAAEKLANYERLPSNLGLELVGTLYPSWLAKNAKNKRKVCKDCDSQQPGFFFAWNFDENSMLKSSICRCLCNGAPELKDMPRKSKAQAVREGFIVMPESYSGGPASFEAKIMSEGFKSDSIKIKEDKVKACTNPQMPASPLHKSKSLNTYNYKT